MSVLIGSSMIFSFETMLAAGLCFLAAALVKGLTGLGFLTVCVASLTFVVGLKTAVGLVLVPSLLSNVFIMLDAGRFVETTCRFWPLYLTSVPGLVIGVQLLIMVDQNLAAAMLGSVIVWLQRPGSHQTEHCDRRSLQAAAAAAGGLRAWCRCRPHRVAGHAAVSVSIRTQARARRAAAGVHTIFTLCSVSMAVLLVMSDLLTPEIALLSAAGSLPTYFGVQLGSRMRRRFCGEALRVIILWVILGLGLALMVRAI